LNLSQRLQYTHGARVRRDRRQLSKTYEALIKAEKLRAAQDPAALARRVARAAEEGETLRAELRVCQQQLAELSNRVDATAVDPAAIDDLGRRVAQLAAQQERLAAEPRQLLQAAIRQFNEELDRRWAALQSQSDQVAAISLRLEEVHDAVVPKLETIRGELDELRGRSDELQRTRQTERQTLAVELERLREAMARATLAAEDQQREQRRFAHELAAVRDAQQDVPRQAQRLASLSELVESVSERLEQVEANHRVDADRSLADAQSLKQGVDRLRVALVESASAAVDPAQVETLRAGLDALRERLATADDEHQRLRQRWDEQLAAQRGLVAQLAVIEEAQDRSDRRLRDVLGTLEPLLTGQTQSAGRIDALSEKVAALAEAQRRQQKLVEDVRRARASAEEAEKHITRIDAAQTSNAEAFRCQMEKLREDLLKKVSSVQQLAKAAQRSRSTGEKAGRRQAANDDEPSPKMETWRRQMEELRANLLEKMSSVQSSLAEPLRSVGEIAELRAQLGTLAEVQAQQRQLAERVEQAQASAEEAARQIAALDQAQAPAEEALRRQIEELRGILTEKVSSLEALLSGSLRSVGEIEELRAQMGALPEVQGRQQELAEHVERAHARVEDATRRIAAINQAQASKEETLRRQMEELREGLLEKMRASLAEPLQSVREIEALRARVDAFTEVQARQRQLAESMERVHARAEEAAQETRVIDEAHASSLALLQRQVAELQTDREALRNALGAVKSTLAEQKELADSVEVLRARIVPLVKAQARQDELAEAVSRAQNAADEARRRIATSEEARSTTLTELRRQVDALATESGAWRVVDVAAQSALARQEETAREIDALRTKLARMLDAQERQQQLFEDLLVAPASSDDHRLTADDSEEPPDLAGLRRQVAALQADRLKLDAFLEARFEVLCDILDAELQAKVDELAGGVRGPAELERLARKILPESLLRGAASIAGLRKKAR
jgi:DNA repair exonuclease SbcCD ATPase subunit